MKNSSWLRTYVVNSRSEVSVRSCKESTVCCSVTCGVEYWDYKTVITAISFPWRKQARSMISFRAAWLKTLVRSLRRGVVDHQPLIVYLWLFTFWLSIHKFFSYSSGPRINVLQALRQDIADEIVAKFTLFTRSKEELRAFTLRVSICQNLPTSGFTLVLSYVTDYEKHCVDFKQTKQSGKILWHTETVNL